MNREMRASDQLRGAARLIERALAQLDAGTHTCSGECGRTMFDNLTEGKVHERLQALPQRLQEAADDLDDHNR